MTRAILPVCVFALLALCSLPLHADDSSLQIAQTGDQRNCLEVLRVIQETRRIIESGQGDSYHREHLKTLIAAFQAMQCQRILGS